MHPFQRRLLGNRVYWRDGDVDRIAKHFDLTTKDVADLPMLREGDVAPLVEAKDAEPAADGSAREKFKFILSSNAVDSYGDTIDQAGWDYSRANKNFPTLAFHDSQALPIGRWVSRSMENGMLKGETVLSDRRFAQEVGKEINAGNIIAASVGFIPGEWEWSTDPKRKYGIDFKKGHTLIEASIVAIGANPDALLEKTIGAMKEISVAQWEALMALPNEFRAAASKVPASAKGASGIWRRCANLAEKAIKGDDAVSPAPSLDMYRRRLTVARARIA